MSHHFRAKGGTVFNFNSDLSGPATIGLENAPLGRLDDTPLCWSQVPCADLFEFVEWYRRTPGYGVDEEALGETLTEEERVLVNSKMLPGGKDAVAKLLRIHDALQARVKELEGEREPDIEPPGETIAKLLHEKTLLDVRVKELELLRGRIERLRDGLSFDSGWEEGERVVLTRILNGKDPE